MRFRTALILWGLTLISLAAADEKGPSLARIVRESDSIIIDYLIGQKSETVRFEDPEWRERLAAALEGGRFELAGHCLCISYPIITIVRHNDIVLRLSVHHGMRLRVTSNRVMSDFVVGPDLGKAVTSLAMERKKADKAPQPTTTSIKPRANERRIE